MFLTCFGVSLGFCWVSIGFSGGWEWIVHLGVHQVGFRFFGGLNHVFSSDPVRFWGVFDVFWGFRCVLLSS